MLYSHIELKRSVWVHRGQTRSMWSINRTKSGFVLSHLLVACSSYACVRCHPGSAAGALCSLRMRGQQGLGTCRTSHNTHAPAAATPPGSTILHPQRQGAAGPSSTILLEYVWRPSGGCGTQTLAWSTVLGTVLDSMRSSRIPLLQANRRTARLLSQWVRLLTSLLAPLLFICLGQQDLAASLLRAATPGYVYSVRMLHSCLSLCSLSPVGGTASAGRCTNCYASVWHLDRVIFTLFILLFVSGLYRRRIFNNVMGAIIKKYYASRNKYPGLPRCTGG
jgi:hypothetical protein